MLGRRRCLLPLLVGAGLLEQAAADARTTTDTANKGEADALREMRDGLTDKSGLFRTNWTDGTDVCTWKGVACSYSGVTLLNLRNKDLTGELPDDFFARLPNLHAIYLQGNRITGKLALGSMLRACTKLKALYLHEGNHFKGSFGVKEGERIYAGELRVLNIANNQLEGPLPSFASFDKLEELDLRGNSFKGKLHPSVFELKHLRTLHVDHNALSGTLPASAPKKRHRFPKEFKALGVAGNSFTGPLPGWLFELAQDTLLDVDVSSNEFTGTIPESFGLLTSVKAIDASHNQLTGCFPPHLDWLTSLEFFSFEHNKLHCGIPGELGQLRKLKSIKVAHNNLYGEIPLELADAPQLTEMVVEGNYDLCGLEPEEQDPRALRLRKIVQSTDQTAVGKACRRLPTYVPSDPEEL